MLGLFEVELVAEWLTHLSSHNCFLCSGVVLASYLQGEFTVEMQVEGNKFSGAGTEILLSLWPWSVHIN